MDTPSPAEQKDSSVPTFFVSRKIFGDIFRYWRYRLVNVGVLEVWVMARNGHDSRQLITKLRSGFLVERTVWLGK